MSNGGIGDGILQFPVLMALRKAHPGQSVVWAGRRDVGELALAAGVVDSCLPEAGMPYDLVVQPNSALEASQRALYGGRFEAPALDAAAAEPPASQVLRQLGLPPTIDFGLGVLRAAQPDRTVALITGASSPAKSWPEAWWMDLATFLPPSCRLFLPCDREGAALAARIAGAVAPVRATVARVSLVDQARQLGQCCAYVGLETGLTHLAHALGLPGVFLWAFEGYQAYRPGAPAIVCSRVATPTLVKIALRLRVATPTLVKIALRL